MLKIYRLPKFRTWWRAWMDARKDEPSSDSANLHNSEQLIVRKSNQLMKDLEKIYSKKIERGESARNYLQTERNKYKKQYTAQAREIQRWDVLIYLHPVLHWSLMVLLAIGEGAFNIVAFNVLREPGIVTVITALMVVIAIPVCALFIGIRIRQLPPPHLRTALEIICVTIFIVGGLIFINKLRFSYLGEIDREFAATHPEVGQAFLAINLLVFIAATVVAYLGHDPKQGFAEVKNKYEHYNKALHTIEGKLDHWASEYLAEYDKIKEAALYLINYYRMINRRKRSSEPPKYFTEITNDGATIISFIQARKCVQYQKGPREETKESELTDEALEDIYVENK